MTSIDAYLQQRRFQNPRLISEFDGSYAPRDLKEYKPDAEDEWTNHTDIKKWRDLQDRARANGRCNELIDKDKRVIFLMRQCAPNVKI